MVRFDDMGSGGNSRDRRRAARIAKKPAQQAATELLAATATADGDKKIESFRLSKREVLPLIIGTSLALASLRASDPFVVIPMISISWVAFLYLCIVHAGDAENRTALALLVTGMLMFVAYREISPGGFLGYAGLVEYTRPVVLKPDGKSRFVAHEVGKVGTYFGPGGTGLIDRPDGHTIDVSRDDIIEPGQSLAEGERVEYDVVRGPNGVRATKVKLFHDSAATAKQEDKPIRVRHETGKVSSWDSKYGHGDIMSDDTDQIIDMDRSGIIEPGGSLTFGEIVEYDVVRGQVA